MNQDERLTELASLRDRVARLEFDIANATHGDASWPPHGYYTAYHVLAGMVLGLMGAASSLLFNIVGSAMVGQHPLELIRVYLTFPLGEQALRVESGFALAAGCCLYLGTGMLLGIPVQLVLTRFCEKATFARRFLVVSLLGIALWLLNFYGILFWLQPAIVGGSWIIEKVPVMVAILTHLIFAWTMLLVSQWGRFTTPVMTQEGAQA